MTEVLAKKLGIKEIYLPMPRAHVRLEVEKHENGTYWAEMNGQKFQVKQLDGSDRIISGWYPIDYFEQLKNEGRRTSLTHDEAMKFGL